VKQHTHLRI